MFVNFFVFSMQFCDWILEDISTCIIPSYNMHIISLCQLFKNKDQYQKPKKIFEVAFLAMCTVQLHFHEMIFSWLRYYWPMWLEKLNYMCFFEGEQLNKSCQEVLITQDTILNDKLDKWKLSANYLIKQNALY